MIWYYKTEYILLWWTGIEHLKKIFSSVKNIILFFTLWSTKKFPLNSLKFLSHETLNLKILILVYLHAIVLPLIFFFLMKSIYLAIISNYIFWYLHFKWCSKGINVVLFILSGVVMYLWNFVIIVINFVFILYLNFKIP